MKVADYVDVKLITFLESRSRNEALKELIDLVEKENKLKNPKGFHKAILEREKLSSTGVGLGVALPHAKIDELKDFFIVIGIQKNRNSGLEWHSIDKLPVRIIFLIGGPTNKQGEYLQLLSAITKFIKEDELRHKILHANSPEEVFKLLS